jgi:general secretion pathway protein G
VKAGHLTWRSTLRCVRTCNATPPSHQRGFTLIELLITLAILATLASLVVPLAQLQIQRGKEQQLRYALRDIRTAIDAYKKAGDDGRIRRNAGESGYPKSLDALVQGAEDQRDPKRKKLYFLREVPRDPFVDEASLASADTWIKRSYANDADDFSDGDDVYDVRSRSALIGLNGAPLSQW